MLITMGLLILAGNTWYADVTRTIRILSPNEQLSHIPSIYYLDTAPFSSR